jgi:hypothetical protein
MSHAISPRRKTPYPVVESYDADYRRVTPNDAATFHAPANPLWIIVIALACFFTVTALIIACG